MDIGIRSVGEEEFESFRAAVSAGFGGELREEELEHDRAIAELDRTVAALDGPQIVGTTGAFSFELTVPGGFLPAAGVTAVTVLPTHRRRGILTRMMRHQLEDVHKRGEPLAILWASESLIYGRFGYGMAVEDLELTIQREHAVLSEIPGPSGRVRLVSRQEALKVWPEVYDRVRGHRPGGLARTAEWWEHQTLYDPEHWRDGYTSNRHALYEEGGEALGYVRYRIKHEWPEGFPASELLVGELVGVSAEVRAALWQYVFGVDLIGTIKARRRPVDDELFWRLKDPRRLRRAPSDALWVRLVDLPAALAARRYSVEGALVLEVRDAFCPWNEGRYELEAGPGGAECRTTRRSPDLSLGAAELAAGYLGRAPFSVLRRAGRVDGEREALRRADLMFSWDPLPWAIEVF